MLRPYAQPGTVRAQHGRYRCHTRRNAPFTARQQHGTRDCAILAESVAGRTVARLQSAEWEGMHDTEDPWLRRTGLDMPALRDEESWLAQVLQWMRGASARRRLLRTARGREATHRPQGDRLGQGRPGRALPILRRPQRVGSNVLRRVRR